MGADYYIHVGPYALCNYTTRPAQEKRNICTDARCRFYIGGLTPDTKFCPKCGTPAEERIITVLSREVSTVSVGDIIAEIDHVLCGFNMEYAEGVHLWVPNGSTTRKMTIDTHDGPECGEILEPTPEMIETEKREFAEQFASALTVLRERYKGRVEIKWGVLGEFN
jgi:hypothetical protein